MTPSWWTGLVLALAAFRLTRLTGWDDFPPVAWARARLTGEKAETSGSMAARHGLTNERPEVVYRYRWPTLAHGLHCAYCAGAWWSAAIYLAWIAEPRWTMYGAYPTAASAFVGLTARNLDP